MQYSYRKMFFKKINTIFDKEKLSEPFLSPPNSSISNCMKIYFQPCHFKAKTILSLYYTQYPIIRNGLIRNASEIWGKLKKPLVTG